MKSVDGVTRISQRKRTHMHTSACMPSERQRRIESGERDGREGDLSGKALTANDCHSLYLFVCHESLLICSSWPMHIAHCTTTSSFSVCNAPPIVWWTSLTCTQAFSISPTLALSRCHWSFNGWRQSAATIEIHRPRQSTGRATRQRPHSTQFIMKSLRFIVFIAYHGNFHSPQPYRFTRRANE